ncbi:MAG: 5'/3'-nucleotidase SurE [Chloroflexi bacterium]|nr:5'/3'-nucleotidase SurE [Chloroflexota bacterium]
MRASKPLFFVTNDDGIHSPGLKAAVQALLPLGDVLVVAPTHQQTSMGRSMPPTDGVVHSITLDVDGQPVQAYHLDASPALAVLYGILLFARDRMPDVLVSGINYGENLGSGVTISGTVGAALQGASMGIPSLAVSLETDHAFHYHHGEVQWDTAIHFTRLFARKMLACELPFDVDVLKVDIPSDATEQTPWKITRLSRRSYYTSFLAEEGEGPRFGGRLVYRVGVRPEELEPGTDIYAFLVERVVSVTPLSLDMTSRVDLRRLEEELKEECASSGKGEQG